MARVRYITVSRLAIELVSSLPDADNATFNKILFSCFQQLEEGKQLTIPETDNPVLNVAIREAVQELETGYKNYAQRINARKKGSSKAETENQRSITDQSPINQRSTIEEKRIEEKRKEENFDTIQQIGIDEQQRAEIEKRLKDLGIEKADSGFWNTAFVHGYKATDDALTKAESTGNGNLKYITQMIANGF